MPEPLSFDCVLLALPSAESAITNNMSTTSLANPRPVKTPHLNDTVVTARARRSVSLGWSAGTSVVEHPGTLPPAPAASSRIASTQPRERPAEAAARCHTA
jgi:hypothetical protein